MRDGRTPPVADRLPRTTSLVRSVSMSLSSSTIGCVVVCLLGASLLAGQPRTASDPVKTAAGLVSGTAGSAAGVTAYLGIPYAAPPVGDLRWREPQPAAAWQGVKQATSFGTSCMQQQARFAPAVDRGVHDPERRRRGLSLAQRLDPRGASDDAPRGDGVDLRRRVQRGLERGGGLRRRAARVAGRRRGESELPHRCARRIGASRTLEGITAWRVG